VLERMPSMQKALCSFPVPQKNIFIDRNNFKFVLSKLHTYKHTYNVFSSEFHVLDWSGNTVSDLHTVQYCCVFNEEVEV
jgi:hypothetical protein